MGNAEQDDAKAEVSALKAEPGDAKAERSAVKPEAEAECRTQCRESRSS
ncbi:hypothetical protein KFZ58_16780 [Virgibacillus sp. NKC19-16]|nr:hypothetical protein [Virgibacillus sp. NKC19-16]UJL45999.1 hypothetical protein KFZ58_16780 [Virgibacillus sp. NKC19-16]